MHIKKELTVVILAVLTISVFGSSYRPASATTSLNLDPHQTYNNIIPPTNYGIRNGINIGNQYPPVGVAMKCAYYFSAVNNQTSWEYGKYVAEWLALRAHDGGNNTTYFTYDFPWPMYNLTAGWKSGLAQGLVSECFMKAASYTGNSTFNDLARESLLYLKTPESQGGVMIDEGANRWWFEEYAGVGGSNPMVFNGHQFTLISLGTYLQKVDPNDAEIKAIFDRGLAAMKFDAPMYDYGYNYSLYDRERNMAGKYHPTHIINMQRLYDMTHDAELLKLKKMFEQV